MQNMPRYIFLILHHVLAFDEFLCTIFYNNVSVLLVKNINIFVAFYNLGWASYFEGEWKYTLDQMR